MKTCKDCRKFNTPECMFGDLARPTWAACGNAYLTPTELEKAQWFFCGWRRLWDVSNEFRVNGRRIKADTRLCLALRSHGKKQKGATK